MSRVLSQRYKQLCSYSCIACNCLRIYSFVVFFFFQAEDGIRDIGVTGVQTCALPISPSRKVAKHSFPVFREKMTRPVTPTCCSVIVSGGRSGWPARTAPRVVVRAKIGRASCRERV